MSRAVAAAGLLLLLALTGCAGGVMTASSSSSGQASPEPTPSGRTPFQTATPGAIAPSGTPAAVPAERWDAIVADLAGRGVTGTPAVVSSQSVTWQNGALGCAQPGSSYTQAQVDGMQVVVAVGDQQYDYRFGSGDTPLLCQR